MRDKDSTNYLAWSALTASLTALAVLAYIKHKFVFESVNFAQSLERATEIFTFSAVILGAMSVKRGQGVAALLIAAFVVYSLLFTDVWAIS